jgi:hypothetical protein
MIGMTTYVISAKADRTGVDVEIECRNGSRRSTRSFETQSAAEAWIVSTRRLADSVDRPRQSHFRVLWLV